MNELYYNKYLKYRNKYLYLKLSIPSHQSGGNNNQKTYLNTQNMFESSLSEELSIFDFTSNSFMKVCYENIYQYYFAVRVLPIEKNRI